MNEEFDQLALNTNASSNDEQCETQEQPDIEIEAENNIEYIELDFEPLSRNPVSMECAKVSSMDDIDGLIKQALSMGESGPDEVVFFFRRQFILWERKSNKTTYYSERSHD